MNFRPLILVSLLSILAGSLAASTPATANEVDLQPIERFTARPTVAAGMRPDEVRGALGQPAQVLRPEVWVYWNFSGGSEAARSAGFDTLLVNFQQGRAAELRMVSGTSLRELLARYKIAVAVDNRKSARN